MSVEDLQIWEATIREGPTLDIISMECFGLHGYGTGRVVSGSVGLRPDNRVVGGCDACPQAQPCWEALREEARSLLPELMEELDRLTEEGLLGPPLMEAWAKSTGQDPKNMILPPDMLLETIHLRIGAEHTAREAVK